MRRSSFRCFAFFVVVPSNSEIFAPSSSSVGKDPSISIFFYKLLICFIVFRPGWNNTNNGNAKTTIVPQPQPVVQVNPGALSSRRSEHRSIQTDRRRLPQPVVSTTIMKNRPPIETILPKLLALRQN